MVTVVVPPPASFKYLPALQLKQRLKELCASVEDVAVSNTPLALVASVKYLPEGHTLQLPEPVASWKVPAKQLVQLADAANEKLPMMQLRHSDEAMCDVAATVVVPPPASFK